MNRMVECGGCDHQFRINEDVIVRTRKFYPGEKHPVALNQFQRVPLSLTHIPPEMQTVSYQEFNHPEQLVPASPQRIIAGIFGVSIMVFTALLLLFSSKPTAVFGSMPMQNKLIVAGFVSLLGFVLLVYANPRARIKAALVGLLLAAGVVCLPFYIEGTPIKSSTVIEESTEEEPITDFVSPEEKIDALEALRLRFSTKPLENEQERLAEANSPKQAYGIYLRGMVGRNKYTARDYLIRESGGSFASHLYPRDNGNYLMVLTEVEKSSDEISEIAAELGTIEEFHSEIGIFVVGVDNALFLVGSAEKLNDRTHPDFYTLNRRELQSIDLNRVQKAVERLADSEATMLRSDTTEIMIELLNKPGVIFHDSIARALMKWAEDIGPAADAGLDTLKIYNAKKMPAPEHLVKLVADGKNPEAIPTMVELWENNPILWDSQLAKFGQAIEPFVLEKLNSEQAPLHRSAIKLLGRIGSEKSLPELKKALKQEDPESRVLAERAIQEIENR